MVLELHQNLDALARQDQYHILKPLVGKSRAQVGRNTRRARGAAAVDHSELKIVDVHRVGHGRVVDEFLDVGRAKPHALVVRDRFHIESPAVEKHLAAPHGQTDCPRPSAVDRFA